MTSPTMLEAHWRLAVPDEAQVQQLAAALRVEPLVARLLNGGVVSAGIVSMRPGDTVRVQLPLNRSMLMVLP